MNVKDSISATMDSIEGNESGDQSAKNIFSYKPIMGNILKYTVAEYKDCSLEEIKESAVNDFNLRIIKPLKNAHMEDGEKEQLMKAVDRAMEKVVNKMLFGLRDSMNEQAFLECVAGLEKTYEK